MDVFNLDETVIDRYKTFARSFTTIRSPELKEKVGDLYATKRFWPDPLLQLNPHYAPGGSIQDFIDAAIKARKAGQNPRTRAIVICPMNALANNQAEELRRYLGARHPHTPTFARYTGQEGMDERERIRSPSHDFFGQ